MLQNSIFEELSAHIDNLVEDGVLTLDNIDDWHFHAFNEDYYIIGYYESEKWLEKHGVSAFEAIETIREYEQFNFGEVNTDFSNAEYVVNMYVYIQGEEVLYKRQDNIVAELEEAE